jgi:hypothetical protein
MSEMVDRTLYPELDLILWDNASRYIEKRYAFYVYETRFHFIDTNKLTEREKKLIQDLADDFGGGYLLTK